VIAVDADDVTLAASAGERGCSSDESQITAHVSPGPHACAATMAYDGPGGVAKRTAALALCTLGVNVEA